MKKGLLFLGLASMMSAFVGCTKDTTEASGDEPGQKGTANNPDLVIAMPEGDELTRTMLDATGKNVLWSKGDRIAVFSEQNNSFKVRYTLDGEGGTGTGVFKYTPAPGADNEISLYPCGRKGNATMADPIKQIYVAVYPYTTPNPFRERGGLSTSYNYSLGSHIPADQVYTEGSYDKNALPMIAVFDKNTTKVQFRYLGALLKIPVVGDGVKLTAIKLEANSYEAGGSAGNFPIYPNPATRVYLQFSAMMNAKDTGKTEEELWNKLTNPAEKWTSEASEAILRVQMAGENMPTTLAPEEGTIDLGPTAKNIYIAIAPRNYKSGLVATFVFENGTEYKKELSSSSTNVYAGSVVNCKQVVLNNNMYVPVLTVAGNKVQCTPAASGVARYEFTAQIGEKSSSTHTVWSSEDETPFTGEVDIDSEFRDYVGDLGNTNTIGGMLNATYSMRVVYDNTSTVTWVSSKSVSGEYKVGAPLPKISISKKAQTNFTYLVSLSNAQKYSEIKYAHKVGEHKLSDFQDADFQSFGGANQVEVDFALGDNTVAVRATCATTGTVVSGITSWDATAPILPGEFTLIVRQEAINALLVIDPKEDEMSYEKYLEKYTPSISKIYWKDGANADMTDLSTANVVDGASLSLDPVTGEIYFDLISSVLNPANPYTFVMVLKGTFGTATERSAKASYEPES